MQSSVILFENSGCVPGSHSTSNKRSRAESFRDYLQSAVRLSKFVCQHRFRTLVKLAFGFVCWASMHHVFREIWRCRFCARFQRTTRRCGHAVAHPIVAHQWANLFICWCSEFRRKAQIVPRVLLGRLPASKQKNRNGSSVVGLSSAARYRKRRLTETNKFCNKISRQTLCAIVPVARF